MAGNRNLILERIGMKILLLRGKKVILDRDLVDLYGVEVKALNQSVKRNRERFPEDFMFRLTQEEMGLLRSQNVTLEESGRGRYPKFLSYAFTEQGVAMLSGILRSETAIRVNIQIMRAFVRLREMISSHKELAEKLEELERKYDGQFEAVFVAIRRLMEPETGPPKRRIGF